MTQAHTLPSKGILHLAYELSHPSPFHATHLLPPILLQKKNIYVLVRVFESTCIGLPIFEAIQFKHMSFQQYSKVSPRRLIHIETCLSVCSLNLKYLGRAFNINGRPYIIYVLFNMTLFWSFSFLNWRYSIHFDVWWRDNPLAKNHVNFSQPPYLKIW